MSKKLEALCQLADAQKAAYAAGLSDVGNGVGLEYDDLQHLAAEIRELQSKASRFDGPDGKVTLSLAHFTVAYATDPGGRQWQFGGGPFVVTGELGELGELVKREPARDADGWIEWKGGACPVLPGTLVEAKFRTSTGKGISPSYGVCPAGRLRWSHDGGFGDILAYRVDGGAA